MNRSMVISEFGPTNSSWMRPMIVCKLAEGWTTTTCYIAYKDDIAKYNKPATSKHKTGAGVGTGSPQWLKTFNQLATRVQPFSHRQGTKRKRPASFDVDEADAADGRDGDDQDPATDNGGEPEDSGGNGVEGRAWQHPRQRGGPQLILYRNMINITLLAH
ncbi:hypothetical protein B0H14DRAFT_2625784 [Mycena olivaceomarginata]|nr:hypothetical protein B0H14DRAFT_2625784 [Mycena olivaceomarginata]